MFEVFNVRTGETIGYTVYRATAAITCDRLGAKGIWADYINADEASSGPPPGN